MNSPLCLLAVFRAAEGKSKELKAVLLELIAPTRAEEGCIRYDLWQDQADERLLTFVEEWSNEAALMTHLDTPHVARARQRYASLVAEDVVLRRYHLAG
jgi:quinol monooxygenase YgiN